MSKTHRSGKKETYSYDIFGNPTKIEAEQVDTSEDTGETNTGIKESGKYTYEYDRDGRIKNASGGGIKYTYDYDECGRLKSKSACGRTLLKYEYDLNGNKTAETDVTGKTTHYEYDIADRLTAIRENDRILAEYTYTPCGKVSEIKCGDIKTEYGYDPDGRKAGIKVTVSGSVISDIRYSYDNSGNCIKKVNNSDGLNAVTEYGYDGIGRLTNVNNAGIIETYAYDRAGNRTEHKINDETTEKYSYNEVNELLSMERITNNGSENEIRDFTYDSDGNMISDGRGIYKYDCLNRMTEAVMEDGRKLICRYDAEGLRHETEENGRLIRFIYSGRDVVCEEAEDNITRYIRGNGSLVSSDSENARTYYHYACDSLGSITHVIAGNEFGNGETDGDVDGRILCRYEYDAFGNTISAEETITNRYGFTGEMHDDITDMYYLRARYYAPYMGRFTQADTYHGDGLNLYVYAGNNPVKYVDPSGHYKNNGVKSGSDTTRLGRWMSQDEYDKMVSTGKVQMSGDNKVHVANPADINSFGKQAPKGSLYVEFDVPSNTISKGGTDGWGIINGPGSLLDRLNAKKDCLELQKCRMLPIYQSKGVSNMSDYNYEIVKAAVLEWYEKILSELINQDEIVLSKNNDDALVIDFDFQNCIAQLSVTNSQYVPYQFVYFEAMGIDVSDSEETTPIYSFYDDDTMQKNDVISALDEALLFCSNYKVK